MAHNFYMLINGRTYNDEHKRYYTWRFVEWFDIFDLQEWFEDENGKIPKLNEQRQKEYTRELAWAFIDGEGWRDYQNGGKYGGQKMIEAIFEMNGDISRAMDYGTEEDVKKALCDYIDNNEYNPEIKKYIRSKEWMD